MEPVTRSRFTALEIPGWLLLIFLWLITIYIHGEVPDLIPIHFNFSGVITKYGNKVTLLFFPATASVMFIGLTLLAKYPSVLALDSKAGSESLVYSIRMIRWLKVSIALVFTLVIGFIYLTVLGQTGDHKNLVFPLVVATICLPVVYYIYKILSLKNTA